MTNLQAQAFIIFMLELNQLEDIIEKGDATEGMKEEYLEMKNCLNLLLSLERNKMENELEL